MAINFNDEGKLVMNDVVLNRRADLPAWFHMNEEDEMVPCDDREFYNFVLGFSRVLWRVMEDVDATFAQQRCARYHLRCMTSQIDKDTSEFAALSLYDPFTWEWFD